MPLARRPAIWADLRRWLLRSLGREQEALESGLSGVPPASQHVHYIDKVRACTTTPSSDPGPPSYRSPATRQI